MASSLVRSAMLCALLVNCLCSSTATSPAASAAPADATAEGVLDLLQPCVSCSPSRHPEDNASTATPTTVDTPAAEDSNDNHAEDDHDHDHGHGHGHHYHGHSHSHGHGHGHSHGHSHDEEDEELGHDHVMTSLDTPMRDDAFAMSDEEKIERITGKFAEIMGILGLDLTDDSLRGTPRRVAKMYVKEIFSGLNPANAPAITLFHNQYHYKEMLVERDITLFSHCEHHFVPIYGKAHVAYIPSGKVIGLSKLNRIVRHYSRRPQVQERLTRQIAQALKDALDTDDVAVVVDARHMCVSSRGIEDVASSTVTVDYSGRFLDDATRREFLDHVEHKNH